MIELSVERGGFNNGGYFIYVVWRGWRIIRFAIRFDEVNYIHRWFHLVKEDSIKRGKR